MARTFRRKYALDISQKRCSTSLIWIVQSADLYNGILSRLHWETFSHTTITAQSLTVQTNHQVLIYIDEWNEQRRMDNIFHGWKWQENVKLDCLKCVLCANTTLSCPIIVTWMTRGGVHLILRWQKPCQVPHTSYILSIFMMKKKHSHIPASPTRVQQPGVNYTTLWTVKLLLKLPQTRVA